MLLATSMGSASSMLLVSTAADRTIQPTKVEIILAGGGHTAPRGEGNKYNARMTRSLGSN